MRIPGQELSPPGRVSAADYVVVVGGMNMDIQGRSSGPFRPGDSNPGAASMSPGGVGRNIAENLVRLGARVELVTVLGDDALSEELAASCAKLGIGLRGALRLRATPASQYLCLLDESGRLVGAVASMESIEGLTPERLAERAGLMDGAAWVVVDANLPESSLAWLAGRYGRGGTGSGGLKRAGTPRRPLLCLDTVSAAKAVKAGPLLGAFDLAKPNRAEAEILGGEAIIGEADLPRAARALRALPGGPGLGEVFISLGSGGLYYESDAADPDYERGIARPPRLESVNVSGAGDAACAALVWGRLALASHAGGAAGYSTSDRAAFAVAAAALAAAAPGTVSQELAPDKLYEIAKGVAHERLS